MNSMDRFEEDDREERREDGGGVLNTDDGDGDGESCWLAKTFHCTSQGKPGSAKQGFSWEKYGQWKQEQKQRAARLEKQLKARWELEELIDEQLKSFYVYYHRAMVSVQLKDIPQLLMPSWAPPYELAAMSWLGDWRPSAILELVLGLVSSSSSSSSSTSPSYADYPGAEQLLLQLKHEIRIEEQVLDEEMAEIQATCILHLPFGPMNIKSSEYSLACVQSVFKTIERVITKAQHLRFKALELVLKKVLSPIDAAEFLVAFEEIQDSIHQFAVDQLQKVPVTLPFKALGSS